MKRFRKTGAAAVALILLLAALFTSFAYANTTKFTDINDSWAKQNIINVVTKGLMDGATSTLFKPKELVTHYQALISIARMMNASKVADLAKLEAKYKVKVLDKFKVPANARKEISFLLEKGIISDFDVSAFSVKPNATKKDICMYLGKAFGVKYDPKAPAVVLSFKDSLFIPSIYKPYVDFLIKKGVVSASGDINGNFNPDQTINKESFAKMLDISIVVYQNEILGKDKASAAVVTSNAITVTTSSAVSTTKITTPTAVTPTPTARPTATPTPTPVPNVTPIVTPRPVTSVIAVGYLEQVIPEYSNIVVNVKNSDGVIEKKVYNVDDNGICTINDEPGSFWRLLKDDYVQLTVTNGKVVRVIAENKLRTIKGILKGIDITDKITLSMENEKGELKNYIINESTAIRRDGVSCDYKQLKNGISLEIKTEYDKILSVSAFSTKGQDGGILESITFSRTEGVKIEIIRKDQTRKKYEVSSTIPSMRIIIDGKESPLYALRPGMQVSVDIENEEIVKIVTVQTITKVNLEGTVKYINTRLGIITVDVYDSTSKKYVEKKIFTNNAKIADIKLNTLAIGHLTQGQKLVIIGIEDIDGIAAETILVNN